MVRFAIPIVASLSFAFVAGFTNIPPEFKYMLPQHLHSFIDGLSESDRAILKDVAKNYDSYGSHEKVMAAIKEKSPQLAEQVEHHYQMSMDALKKLSPPAQTFVKELYQTIRKTYTEALSGHKPTPDQLKAKGEQIISKYDALPESAKSDLEKNYPYITKMLKDKDLPAKLAALPLN
nr:fatty acid- and retinol-binding protein 6 [Haemonchus contortus]